MLNDINKNPSCEFAEEIIGYLYGEISGGEKARVETHLTACIACAAEVKAFAVVRSSIGEWKMSAFDSLKNPAFVIPQRENISPVKASFVDTVRAHFASYRWLAATASLAVTVIFVAFALFFHIQTGEQTVAENLNRNSVMPGASHAPPANEFAAAPAPFEDKKTAKNIENEQVLKNSVVKNNKTESAPIAKANQAKKNAVQRPGVSPNNAAARKTERENRTSFRAVKKPTLAGTNDSDEDDSLRLADIFAEISMR